MECMECQLVQVEGQHLFTTTGKLEQLGKKYKRAQQKIRRKYTKQKSLKVLVEGSI